MTDSTGQSSADHEGEIPILPSNISEDQLSIYVANTAHLVLYKLRKEMHREIDKAVARLRIDFENQRTQTREQVAGLLKNHLHREAVL